MTEQKAADIYFDTSDAILNEAFTGFKADYLVLHSLLRKHQPKSYFEIGTAAGIGLNVACNAIYKYSPEAKIYSLDLPPQEAYKSEQYSGGEVGGSCQFPYTQLRGDSLKFDYTQYPCEGYFVDGEHDYAHPLHESNEVFMLNPKIVIWHDADIKEVWMAITDAIDFSKGYDLFRVTDTRIAYALRKPLKNNSA